VALLFIKNGISYLLDKVVEKRQRMQEESRSEHTEGYEGIDRKTYMK
jgi:hypothetical protein